MDLTRYLQKRDELLTTAVPGLEPARRLCALTDEMLAKLADHAATCLPPRTDWSLIALGGYGAGALMPLSDLDLLVVSDAPSPTLKPFVEALLYPLWDAGLSVGHQVRTRAEQLRATRSDLKTLTATLTARPITGDLRLAARTIEACAKDARKRRRAVLLELQARPRPGSPYLLEPDLKEGAGGRRDFDEITWTAAILAGKPVSGPHSLGGLGLLSANELARLHSAAETVASARWELHLTGAGSLMSLDATDSLSTTDPADVQHALADTHHILQGLRARATGEHAEESDSPFDASRVLELVAAGRESLPQLEDAAWSGRLDALVPGFSALMVLRRPGLAHTLTVGAHCLTAATIVSELIKDPSGEISARSAAAIEDPAPLMVAALVHDAGKETPGGGHAQRGAAVAAPVAARFGLSEDAADVSALIELHLVLAETASGADIDDEDTILRAASTIARRELLAPLHLLTIADSLATGPGAWSDWHEALIGRLVMRLDDALAPEVDGAGLAQRAGEVRSAALALVPHESPEAHFIAHAPVRYLVDMDPESVVRHAFLVAGLAGDHAPGAHETGVAPGPLAGSYRVTIAAKDRQGLVAIVAGCLALCGLDILGAQAFTIPGSIAVDTFTVQAATRAEIGPDTWSRFDRVLTAALQNHLSIGVRLAERQRQYRQQPGIPPSVDVKTADPYAATVRVSAPDRFGLLYDVARAIADSDLDIVSVTATTKDQMAVDTFRVVDRDGQVPAEGLLGHMRMRLREIG